MLYKCLDWALEVQGGLDVAKEYISDTTHSMFYSMMMANQLKEQYSAETGVEYDIVIRNRIDYSPHVVLDLKDVKLDDDVLVYQDLNQPDDMISDWFGMGTTNTMNVFCGVYNHIGQLIRQSSEVDGYWCNELLLKHHIANNNKSQRFSVITNGCSGFSGWGEKWIINSDKYCGKMYFVKEKMFLMKDETFYIHRKYFIMDMMMTLKVQKSRS